VRVNLHLFKISRLNGCRDPGSGHLNFRGKSPSVTYCTGICVGHKGILVITATLLSSSAGSEAHPMETLGCFPVRIQR
jgi:hypothetical protein